MKLKKAQKNLQPVFKTAAQYTLKVNLSKLESQRIY